MSKKSKLDKSWITKGTSKVKSSLTDYLTGAIDFQKKVLKEIEKIDVPNFTDSVQQGYKEGIEEVVKIIKNLKSQ